MFKAGILRSFDTWIYSFLKYSDAPREKLEYTENYEKTKCTCNLIPRDILALHIKNRDL